MLLIKIKIRKQKLIYTFFKVEYLLTRMIKKDNEEFYQRTTYSILLELFEMFL
jgi:hypothetical protein